VAATLEKEAGAKAAAVAEAETEAKVEVLNGDPGGSLGFFREC
jgi:hypothetical protein